MDPSEMSVVPDARGARPAGDDERQRALEALLKASGREALPLRHAFVQARADGGHPAPGPLATLVRRSRGGALDQLLLLRAWASGGRHDVRRSAHVWALLLGLGGGPSGQRAVARNWALLSELGQVSLERERRLVRATVLDEGGSGRRYTHPGRSVGDPYLQLPHAYWREGWDRTLSLPAKAMLLIALSLGDGFWLPTARAQPWYGISASSAERGLRELRERGVLDVARARKPAPRTAAGSTLENRYTLRAPFGPKGVRTGARRTVR